MNGELGLGAIYLGEGRCRFRVWAPLSEKVEVHVISPKKRVIPLRSAERGYHHGIVEAVPPGSLYQYRLDGEWERPDPASRFQPQGVHGPSGVVDPRFPWNDDHWCGPPLRDYIIYELHVGLFSPEGTFEAVIPRLDELKELGITAIELMPVAQFPGTRNWGYDGVYPFAVQNSYGGPEGLKRLVNACHRRGLAVILDVVYNHLGPEGNYLADFGPYFTDRYRTPWGSAVNFDGAHSDEVRRFFIENALYWIREFHVDALRIDAVHAIMDFSARPFLEELALVVHEEAEESKRHVFLIAESALNDTRVIHSRERGGWGIDAQWNDDFHHALHALLTGEHEGYYRDFGGFEHMGKAFKEGFVYSGEYSAYRVRRHGRSSRHLPAHQFVVFAQNHDQVGNRAWGERLGHLVSQGRLKIASALVLTSPFIPMLFQGEEWGASTPFQYFTDHQDPGMGEAVHKGRHEEFSPFGWKLEEVPDPQAVETFDRSRLSWEERDQEPHKSILEWYRRLIAIRRSIPSILDGRFDRVEIAFDEEAQWFIVIRGPVIMVCNLADRLQRVPIDRDRSGRLLLSSDSRNITGSGFVELQPDSVVILGQGPER